MVAKLNQEEAEGVPEKGPLGSVFQVNNFKTEGTLVSCKLLRKAAFQPSATAVDPLCSQR